MDRTEYQAKLEELRQYLQVKDYKSALTLVNGIDWRKVKSVRTLNMAADVYEINRDYTNCRYVLEQALVRASVGKSILYRLTEVALKQKDIEAAQGYFEKYSKVASRDNGKLLLEFKLARGMKKPIREQIRILEEYKEREYTERWAYELARLYSRAGEADKCVAACDDLILWFSEGKYVLKAMELKQQYKPLTAMQQAYYDKEQRDSDPRTVFNTTVMEALSNIDIPKIRDSALNVLDRFGERVAKDTKVDASYSSDIKDPNKASVVSAEFMGGSPDLKSELAKLMGDGKPSFLTEEIPVPTQTTPESTAEAPFAVENVPESEMQAEAAPEAETTAQASFESWPDLEKEDAAPEETPVDSHLGSETPVESQVDLEADVEETFDTSAEAEEAVKMLFKTSPKAETEEEGRTPLEKQLLWDDREVPDPEPTPVENKTYTIPLDRLGENTVPTPLEEILKNETPEERRIRILNNAMPTRMSEMQRKIFTYFARIPGMDNQILRAMSNVYQYVGEHTSQHGNVAVMGAAGSGKSRLTEGLITAMSKDMGLKAVKVARLTGEKMNSLDPAQVIARMSGGFLVIEVAGDMSNETVEKLNKAMEFKTDCMILILEDEKNAIRALFGRNKEFAGKFSGIISIPVFTNDELVTFSRTYCAENKCKMDELGVLALYRIISNTQTEGQPMTVSDVKDILDTAISKARRGRRNKKLLANKEEPLVLYEKDFS